MIIKIKIIIKDNSKKLYRFRNLYRKIVHFHYDMRSIMI